jgi:hypothetical protein
MSNKGVKKREESLIKWRRKQVAEMTYENIPVRKQAETLHVDDATIYRDIEWNEEHTDSVLREYIVKTVPNIIAKSLYQINLANGEAIKILKDENSTKKEKLAASLAVAKTAKEAIDIVTNNDDFVDAALELDESAKRKAEEYLYNYGVSEESTTTETESEDPNRVF